MDRYKPCKYPSKRKSKEKFIEYLGRIEKEYVNQFKLSPFAKNISIKELRENIYKKEGKFYDFSAQDSNHIPKAILGKENYLKFLEEEKLKAVFINWMDIYKPSAYKPIRKNRERFIEYLDSIGAEYYKEFNSSPFTESKELTENIYKDEGSFYHFSAQDSNHRPRAILGKENYLRFLEEKKSTNMMRYFDLYSWQYAFI